MKKTIAVLSAAAVAAVTLGAAMPASAAPAAGGPQVGPQIVQAASHPRFYLHDHYAYYNGHRGDRHRHPGWRYYNGWWFPPAAFIGAAIGGAIIGGMIAHAH
jgi:hypothetical protein